MLKFDYTRNKIQFIKWMGLIFLSIFISYSISLELSLHYFLFVLILLVIGFINPVIGIVLAYSLMNNLFDLFPSIVFEDLPINKMWDFGFILIIIYSFPIFIRDYKPFRIWPTYLKFLFLFLGICLLSFLYTVFSYKYPAVDALRTVRPYFGYLTFFIFLQYFQQKGDNAKRFFNILYFISFGLLILYNIQFVIQKQIFFGYQQIISINKTEILRSIPNFMEVSFLFMWYNMAALLQGRPQLKFAKIYLILSFLATIFTFTRGLYISIGFGASVLILILFFQRKIFLKRMLFLQHLVIFFVIITSGTSYFQPFIERTFSIKDALFTRRDDSTIGFRLSILQNRVEMVMTQNPYIGIGFVHNKYGKDFGRFLGSNYEPIEGPALWSSDIAWANIIYQTGFLGFVSFLLFALYLLKRYPRGMTNGKTDFTILLEYSVYIELIRNILMMFVSAVFTDNTQNIALLLSFLIYIDYKSMKIGSIYPNLRKA